jgi:hypothetical protein
MPENLWPEREKDFLAEKVEGQMLSYYERAVISAKIINKPFNFIRLHI